MWGKNNLNKTAVYTLDVINEDFISNKDKILSLWNNITSGLLNKDILENIEKVTNNSIIGGSKLLHFINPESYAIFDSKVYKAITKNKAYQYNLNIDNYLLYMNKLSKLTSNKEKMELLKNKFHEKNEKNNRLTNFRYIELILFFSEKL